MLEQEQAEAREQLLRTEQRLELAGAESRGLEEQLETQAARFRRQKDELKKQLGQVRAEAHVCCVHRGGWLQGARQRWATGTTLRDRPRGHHGEVGHV